MKPFMMAGALAAGTLKPTDSINCEHGVYQIGGVTIHDTHLNDVLTPTQVLAKSSNIGALKIGLQLGEPALYAAYRRFGFGEPTGIPLPGEASGVLRPKGRAWYDAETASASFGQGISVTTLQLAMAMSAIANGGSSARADPRQEGHRRPRRDRARIERPRAARGDPAGGRADGRRDADRRDRGRRDRRRGGDPRLSRRGQDVDRAEGRSGDGQVLHREVHGRVRRLRTGRAPAARRRRRARRADDWPLWRRPRGPGVPSRGRGEPALPRRHPFGGRRPRSRRSSARATRPTPRSRP